MQASPHSPAPRNQNCIGRWGNFGGLPVPRMATAGPSHAYRAIVAKRRAKENDKHSWSLRSTVGSEKSQKYVMTLSLSQLATGQGLVGLYAYTTQPSSKLSSKSGASTQRGTLVWFVERQTFVPRHHIPELEARIESKHTQTHVYTSADPRTHHDVRLTLHTYALCYNPAVIHVFPGWAQFPIGDVGRRTIRWGTTIGHHAWALMGAHG